MSSVLRESLVQLLRGGGAHLTLEDILTNLPPELRNERPPGNIHSVWELLEHLRITQEDILRYTLDPDWTSPEWPRGYWPDAATFTKERWQTSLEGFNRDLEEVTRGVETWELEARIPHGEGRTYLRQALLVADHNAYHLGQIVEVRRALRSWPP